MIKKNNYYNQRHYFKFIIIHFLYLKFLLIKIKLFEFSSLKPTSERKLEGEINETIPSEDISNESLLNETNMILQENNSLIDKKSPFFYLTGFYLIFLIMCIYIIVIIKRSRLLPQFKEQLKSGILKFLFYANNGALLVSIIFISSVYKISGFAPIGFGLIILTIGTIYYLCNNRENLITIIFERNNAEQLCRLPGLILKLVRYTFECCRCEYYDITVTTIYVDGHVEHTTYCTSILCFIWNLYWLFVKIISTFFTIISYYIFLGLFLLVRMIAKAIYYKYCIKADNSNDVNNVNDKNNVNFNKNLNNENNVNGKNNSLIKMDIKRKHNNLNNKELQTGTEHNNIINKPINGDFPSYDEVINKANENLTKNPRNGNNNSNNKENKNIKIEDLQNIPNKSENEKQNKNDISQNDQKKDDNINDAKPNSNKDDISFNIISLNNNNNGNKNNRPPAPIENATNENNNDNIYYSKNEESEDMEYDII